MSAFERLRVVRAMLMLGIAVRALAWGIAAGGTLFVGAALLDAIVPVSLAARNALLVVALVSALVIALAVGWRDRAVLSIERVALWIEEHYPSLEYTLVTAVETGDDTIVPVERASA